MGTHDMYPLHTGYLTKSPPEGGVVGNFKRWMKRWFVLWDDKTLEYYEDREDAKPKKTIDLSRCEFLDTNLTAKKFKNIFCIRISGKTERMSGRTYYLAAESQYEMTEWVNKICELCDFKAKETNNNRDTTIRHQLAPLDIESVPSIHGEDRDSGIIVPEPGDTGDLVAVTVRPSPSPISSSSLTSSAYDEVPAPRPTKPNGNYDFPLQHLSRKSPVDHCNSCPLDVSSSSDSISSSIKKRSCHSENTDTTFPNYDIVPSPNRHQQQYVSSSQRDYPSDEEYQVPPARPNDPLRYDVPTQHNYPSHQEYDVPPSQHNYHSHQQYDVLPFHQSLSPLEKSCSNYDVPPKTSAVSEEGQEIYDVPPHSNYHPSEADYDVPPQPTYDTVPPPTPSTAQSNTMPAHRGMIRVSYHGRDQTPGMVQQYPNQHRSVRPVGSNPPGLQYTNYSTLPVNTGRSIYDQVRTRSPEHSTYNTVRPQNLPSGDTSCSNYDEVPAPVAFHQTDDEVDAPPVPRDRKPATPKKAYVNLTFPTDEATGYKKPLPSTPPQQDSGTELDVDEAVYDVPPVQHIGHSAPCVDRTNKPGMAVAPEVKRSLKPSKIRDYVNLNPNNLGMTRSATVREGTPARRGGNVQRSKSAAADFESEGYLYMESPKRTESSLRYSKKDKKSSFDEEEENELEYEYMHRDLGESVYQNYDTPQQAKKEPSSPERTPQLRGHYQDIAVVCQGRTAVPERSPRTEYTTIDLEKTKGFRKTCEEHGKGQ